MGLPAFGPAAPSEWGALSDEGRREALLGDEQCEIGEQVFLRARLSIPVREGDDAFVWLVWVELSPADYDRSGALWEVDGREREPAYLGRLAVELPTYSSPTHGLAVRVRTMPVGQRPEVEVIDAHPLRDEQRDGLSSSEAIARAEELLHPGVR